MTITVLIPHWLTLEMTAFTVAQYLKYKGNHKIEIIVIDNSYPDESIKGLAPFKNDITILNNTSKKTSSHGTAYDMAMPFVKTDFVLLSESDSFPVKDGFLGYYDQLIEGGFEYAASLMTLSGGSYGHPAAALLSKKLWLEAKEYCDSMPYSYFPAMLLRDNANAHMMIHDSMVDKVLENPDEWFELTTDYKPYSKEFALEKRDSYLPVTGPCHNGMGGRQESIHNFGGRTWESDVPFIIYNEKWQKVIGRMGYEPCQWLYYFAIARGKKVFNIPTEIKWMPGKANRQQEYTLTESGIKHLWGISAYHNNTPKGDEEVAKIKQSIPEQLYNTLPPNQRIK